MHDDFSLRITVMPPERLHEEEIAPTTPFERASAAEQARARAPRPLPPMRGTGGTQLAPRPTAPTTVMGRPLPRPALISSALPPPPLRTVPPLGSVPPPPIATGGARAPLGSAYAPPHPSAGALYGSARPARVAAGEPEAPSPLPPALPPPPMVAPLAPMPMLSPLPAPLPAPAPLDPLSSSMTPLPGVAMPTAPPRLPRATLDAVRATAPTQVMTSPRRRAEDEVGRGPSGTPARGVAVASMYDDLDAAPVAPTLAATRPRRPTPSPRPALTAEERRARARARAGQRREWARDLLRRFQF